MGKTLLEAIVKETKKCRHPSKFYVYVLEVTWSEGTSTIIYRRYSDFFEFQCGLLERFPEEAGAKDPSARIIPFLPGKKLLGRSQVRAVAEKRRDKINDYCKALVRLPPKISDDAFVHNFFELRLEDMHDPSKADRERATPTGEVEEISGPIVLERYVAVADYEKQKKNECDLTAGQMVEVIDKNQNGWWFVSLDNFNEGWVPATYLDPLYGTEEAQVEVFAPGQEQYVTSSGYHAQNPDELSFEKGVIVDVCTKGLDGWWKIRYKDREGLAPAAYLTRYTGPQLAGASPTQLVGSVREAVQQASGSKVSWQPSESARIDVQEPIYAPTPRKLSVKRQIKRRELPSIPIASVSATTEPSDEPCPVYEVIPEPEEEVYMTIADFQAANAGDGLSFSAGCSVTVVTKNPSGWWYVEMGLKEGWVPSSYLERTGRRVATPIPAHPAKSSPVAIAITPSASRPKTKSQELRSLSVQQTSKRHTPVGRSSSSEDQTRNKPQVVPYKQQSEASLGVPKPHLRSHSASSRDSKPDQRERTNTSRVENKQISELTRVLQKKQATAHSEIKTVTSRSTPKTPSPATSRRLDLSMKQPQWSKPGSTSAKLSSGGSTTARTPIGGSTTTRTPIGGSTTARTSSGGSTTARTSSGGSTTARTPIGGSTTARTSSGGSTTAKRAPPKRPAPPSASAISHTQSKKKAPPRPTTSPGQNRKTSSYIVMCEYSGGEGQLSLRPGQSVEVLEKNSDGWWYVKIGMREGWAPSLFLEEGKSKPQRPANGSPHPKPAQPIIESSKPSPVQRPVPKPRRSSAAAASSNTYTAAASYQVPAYEDSGINLVIGRTYKVMEKVEGWWFVSDGQSDGWAPSSYLDPA